MHIKKLGQTFSLIKAKHTERFINKYLYINNSNMTPELIQQMRQSRKTLAKYAHDNFVKIHISPTKINDKDGLNISVMKEYKNNSKIRDFRCTNAFINTAQDSFLYKNKRPIMYNIPGEDTQIVQYVYSIFDDNLLRHIFRTVEQLTETIKK